MARKKSEPQKNFFIVLPKVYVDLLKNKYFLIFLVTFLAYFQTLLMYFWNDDNAIIFKLQNLNEGVGNLGSGVLGLDSPYRMVIFSLIPIYYFFRVNPVAFFAYGLFFYFLAAIMVYFFAKSFFKQSKLALLTSLIFASGLVGAESLWRVYNSVHTSITIIYILAFVIFYNYFISQKNLEKKIFYFFLAFIFYYLSIKWGFVRAHGVVLIILAQELLFNFNWRYSIIRIAPFLYLSYVSYFAPNENSKHPLLLFTRLIENYEFELLLVPLRTLKNIFWADAFHSSLGLFTFFLLLLVLKFRARIFFFSLVFIVSSYLLYYVIYQDVSLNTTHRYLTTAVPGLSLLTVFILSRIFKKDNHLYLACALLIGFNITLINCIQFDIVKNRSIPTKNFYSALKKEIPTLNKNSVIYFDVKKDADSLYQFESFFGVGSMPNSTAVAIYYNLDRYDVFLPSTFGEMIKLIREKGIDKKDVYTFFFSKDNGLKNTTKRFKEFVWGGQKEFSFNDLDNINYQISSPFKANLSIKPTVRKSLEKYNQDIKDLKIYLDYLQSKRRYYNLVSVKSDTSWQNFTIDKISDQDYSSSWMASRGVWNDLTKENIILDFGEERFIGAIKLKFGASDKTPTKYIYYCSNDGVSWKDLKTVYLEPKEHAQTRIDLVDKSLCRFLKVGIDETDKGDSPEIAEVEVIEQGYEKLDFKLASEYEEKIASLLNSDEKDIVLDYLLKNGLKMKVCFITDEFDDLTDGAKSKFCHDKYAALDENNTFEMLLPQSGTTLKKIMILPQPNIEFVISNVSIVNVLFEEL